VPSVSNFSQDSSDIGKYAGTGLIQVYNSESLIPGVSPTPLTVRFSAKNKFTTSSELPPSVSLKHTLREANSHGGFTMSFGSKLMNDSDAKERFLSALKTWKCATKINFDTSSIHPNTGGIVCLIDIGSLPGGTLGVTKESHYKCKETVSGKFIRSSMARFTIIFNDSLPFYKGENPVSISDTQFDFEAVALHELGHSHGLNHVNQIDDVMYFSGETGTNGSGKRTLRAGDIEGGLYIMGISKVAYPATNCSFNPMTDADISDLGCSTQSNELIINKYNIIAFPNPVGVNLNIKVEGFERTYQTRFIVFDITGRQVKVVEMPIFNGEEVLDVSHLNTGMYFLEIRLGDFISQTTKFVKQ
jgi:hypothetical protein